jgi:hypothetical protein
LLQKLTQGSGQTPFNLADQISIWEWTQSNSVLFIYAYKLR